MAIPTSVKNSVKGFLFTLITDTDRDSLIANVYERELLRLSNKYDWFYREQSLNTVADQSVYTPSVSTTEITRILAVSLDSVCLRKVTGKTQDLVNNGWQALATTANGTPEFWWPDLIDTTSLSGGNSAGPQSFVLFPTPSTNGSSDILIQTIVQPVSDDPSRSWAYPLLTYRTTAGMIRQNIEEREPETPDEETALATAKFFDAVAEVWETVLSEILTP